MTLTTLTSRKLNQNVGRAKKAEKSGPDFFADRGKPAHVPPSVEECPRLAEQRHSLAEALSMPGLADIEFEPPRLRIEAPLPDLF